MKHVYCRVVSSRVVGTIGGLSVVLTGALGCERNEEREAETEIRSLDTPVRTNEPSTNENTASGDPGTTVSVVNRITAARCAREQRCQNVGAGKEYASMASCESAIREEWQDDLNARDCRGGVVEKELSECLQEIRDEDCNSPFDTLGRVVACRESDICKAMPVR